MSDTDLIEANVSAQNVEEETFSTYLTLDLGEQRLGVDVRQVREILDARAIIPLPNAPSHVLGVVDVRGASVPILDIRAKLGMPSELSSTQARIVVLELGSRGETYPLGIQADRVRNVEQINLEAIEAVPCRGLGGWDARAIRGLCRHDQSFLILINLEYLVGETAVSISLSDEFGIF